MLTYSAPVASGGDLDDYINKKNISVKEALQITHEILDGVNQLHSPPDVYLHRDIKPSNIFMEGNTPLLGDFGSIKKLNSTDNNVSASKMSLFFMTPESIQKKSHYLESDIYQVGLILFMLLGGSISYNPMDYMNEKEKKEYKLIIDDFEKCQFEDKIIHKLINNGKIIDQKSLPFYISKRIKRILNKATNINFRKRYNSIAVFMCEIVKIINNEVDWYGTEKSIGIKNYQKKDFKIDRYDSYWYIHRKTIGSTKWRKEKDSKSRTMEEALLKLMKKINV